MQSFEEILAKVENRREFLKNSSQMLEVIDYGAGNPQDKRTKEQMQKGVRVEVPLKDMASIGVKRDKAEIIYTLFKDLNPKVILELGTCCGFSSSYFSLFAPSAKIFSIEGAPSIAKIARENHAFFGLKNIEVLEGRFDIVLPKLLPNLPKIDFAFIDGHHDKEATLQYFKQILPFMNKGGVMLFDDIAWSEGMKEAWREIVLTKSFSKSKDFGKIGAIWVA